MPLYDYLIKFHEIPSGEYIEFVDDCGYNYFLIKNHFEEIYIWKIPSAPFYWTALLEDGRDS